MATQQVAWTVDGLNNLAILYPNYQTPSYTADWNIIDLTISKSETLMVLTLDGENTVIHHTKEVFPLEWDSITLNLDKVTETSEDPEATIKAEVVRMDASPNDTLYMVLNSGRLVQLAIPSGKKSSTSPKYVQGVENVIQVSAAPDGLVWVVCSDKKAGSLVKWMDPKDGKWNTVPDLINAKKVTGGPKGKAFIINSADELANYTKKGAKTAIPAEFDPKELSIGPDGRLWVISSQSDENLDGGSEVFWTDDDGKNWTLVPGSNVLGLDAGLVDSGFNEN